MTDDPHPDLAGLVAAPLEPYERMGAASLRLGRILDIEGIPRGLILPVSQLITVLSIAEKIHRKGECERDRAGRGPCIPQQIADAVLGEDMTG